MTGPAPLFPEAHGGTATADAEQALDALAAEPVVPPGAPPSEPSAGTPPPKRGPGRPAETRFGNRRSKSEMARAGKELEEENARLKAQLSPDAPSGVANAEQQQKLEDALFLLCSKASQMAGALRGPHWMIPDEESRLMAQVWAPPLLPYIGDAGPWVAAIVTTVLILGPRIIADLQVQKLRQAETASAEVRTRA